MGCLAYGCVAAIAIPFILLWLIWYFFAPWIVFAVATAPTIYLVQHWARFRDEKGYSTLDQTFSFIIGSEPSKAPLSYIVTLILWAGIQLTYYAALLYLFSAFR